METARAAVYLTGLTSPDQQRRWTEPLLVRSLLFFKGESLPVQGDYSGALLVSRSLLNGITPGISHLVHISSTLLWK